MGLYYRHLSCRYFVIFAWIGYVITAQTIRQDSSNGLSHEDISGPSYFFYQRPKFPRDCEEVRQQCLSQNRSGVFFIKPDGFAEPFEVFCDHSEISDDSGWTIILRRHDGSVGNNRTWNEYKRGFGFLGGEFWLGNDKLAYVTNQKQYELQINMVTTNGSSFHVGYDNFRISDEWSGYSLTSVGEYSGTADSFITYCERNLVFGTCACQGTCDQPEIRNGCNQDCVHGEGCVCPDGYLSKGSDCVPENECGCFVQGRGVIPDGDMYVNADCSSRCTCNKDVLTCENYGCDSNANCQEKSDVRMCYCDNGFEGDGQKCTAVARDCLDLYQAGNRRNAVYSIHPSGWSGESFQVYCDMTTADGGWTVFQRRKDGSTNFYRNWSGYKLGFGTLTGELWLGNDKLHAITNQKNYTLRVDLQNSARSSYYALYDLFRVANESDKYRLVGLGSYSGTAGYDAMGSRRYQPFSTHNHDNEVSTYNCADQHRGGWWHGYNDDDGIYCSNTSYCHYWIAGSRYCWCGASSLNGNYQGDDFQSIFWEGLPGNFCGITFTEMKIRPI